jgi:hypothetical protein
LCYLETNELGEIHLRQNAGGARLALSGSDSRTLLEKETPAFCFRNSIGPKLKGPQSTRTDHLIGTTFRLAFSLHR